MWRVAISMTGTLLLPCFFFLFFLFFSYFLEGWGEDRKSVVQIFFFVELVFFAGLIFHDLVICFCNVIGRISWQYELCSII